MDRGSVSQAHHLTFAQPRARGLKVGDQWVVPLCNHHHGQLHASGNEKSWWFRQSAHTASTHRPSFVAEALWAASVAAGRVKNIERKAA